MAALYRVMKENQGAANITSFVEKASREKYYPQLNATLDRQLCMLRNSGIGTERKRAEVITADVEAQMWAEGVLGFHSPQALLNSIFFYNGKNFCLRDVHDHFSLQFSQIHCTTNPDQYTYTEFGSKNHPRGIADHSEGKIVSIIATGTPNCHVRIMDFYLSKVPQNVVKEGGKFYLSPLPFTPTGMRPWFFTNPYPQKKIQGLLKKMCQEAKIEGNFTNHSRNACIQILNYNNLHKVCSYHERQYFSLAGSGCSLQQPLQQ